jgi:transposase
MVFCYFKIGRLKEKDMGIKMEIASESIKTSVLDHHGLVAAVCKDLGIANKIDQKLYTKFDRRRIVSAGTAVVALILNGLGFTNRRLYLTPQFFESKPVELLLGEGFTAEQLDDHTLGKMLDEVSDYGASRLFGEIAFEVALENDLLGSIARLDSTSLSVEGQYDRDDGGEVIKLTYGHSKDHRPDLKQAVMSLIVTGSSAIPIWMEPQNGNSSDKTAFHETIKKVRAFQQQLKGCPEFKWVADSVLYTKDKLLNQNDYLWISRVPETITEAKQLVAKRDSDIKWVGCGKGYKISSFTSHYGGIEQRWLLVFSEKAYQREKETFNKKLAKQDKSLQKALWHLGNEHFSCERDAQKSVNQLIKKYPYHVVNLRIEAILKHKKAGRPRMGAQGEQAGYRIISEIMHCTDTIETMLNRKGRFILATNDLDTESFSDQNLLQEYKQQQDVERGFRFLKDPWFMVDSVFLKSPKRIEALMMVMTLCLMIYNVAQYRLRQTLVKQQETLPNQLNKPIQNPTLRWIFQIMEGISVVRFYEKNIRNPVKVFIANLSDLRIKIINFFGRSAQKIYGIA